MIQMQSLFALFEMSTAAYKMNTKISSIQFVDPMHLPVCSDNDDNCDGRKICIYEFPSSLQIRFEFWDKLLDKRFIW